MSASSTANRLGVESTPSIWTTDEYRTLYLVTHQLPVIEAGSLAPLIETEVTPIGDSTPLLDGLHSKGWLERFTTNLCISVPNQPSVSWFPGNVRPPIQDLRKSTDANQAKGSRLLKTLYRASRLTLNLFGSDWSTHFVRENPECYAEWSELCVRINSSRSATSWRLQTRDVQAGQDEVPERLFFVDRKRGPAYAALIRTSSRRSLGRLHCFCAENNLPYELW